MLLSPDVVDLVLSFLQADITALKSCAQAHPLLSRLAERHLYHRTTLDIKPGGDLEITELSSLLSKNAHIRNYIRILEINIFKDLESQVADGTPVVKAVSSILTTLPCLNKVALRRTPQPWPTMPWNTIHKRLRSSFGNTLQQSSVTEVHLDGFSAFPLSVFNTCQNIKTLSLSSCDKFKWSNLTSPSTHLESLSIQGSSDPTLFDWAIERIGQLTSLNLKAQGEEDTVFQKVFEACARSLKDLELNIHNVGTSEYFPIDDDFYSNIFPEQSDAARDVELSITLSNLSHLEHLTISAMIWAVQEEHDGEEEEIIYHDFVFYTALHAIAQLIKSSAPSLRQVVLRLSCSDFSTINSLLELNWERLTVLGDYPTCPHIDLCISCQDDRHRELSPEEITNTLARHKGLMQLVDRGLFSIKPETKNCS